MAGAKVDLEECLEKARGSCSMPQCSMPLGKKYFTAETKTHHSDIGIGMGESGRMGST